MSEENKAIIIYLDDCIILSKKDYSCWKEVQADYYEKYKTNLEPMFCEEIIRFFEDDFEKEENWPFSRKRILDFFRSNEMVVCSE